MAASKLPNLRHVQSYCTFGYCGNRSTHFEMRMLEVELDRCWCCLGSNCRCMDMEAAVIDVADVAEDSNNFEVLAVVGWHAVAVAAGMELEFVEVAVKA